jgi:adenylylsulfate kinase
MRGGPLEGENEGDPAGAAIPALLAQPVDRLRDARRKRHERDPTRARIRAALGRRGDEVLAAARRALGVDAARLVLEEGTGDAAREVLETDGAHAVDRLGVTQALEETVPLERGQGGGEARAHVRLPLGRHGGDDLGEPAGLRFTDRDELPAARPASGAARDACPVRFHPARRRRGHRVGETLESGKQVGHPRVAARNAAGHVQHLVADAEVGREGDAIRGLAHVRPIAHPPPRAQALRGRLLLAGTPCKPCPHMAEQKATNIVWHEGAVTRADREKLNGHRGCTIWLTGLSGSGKSTVAVALEKALWARGVRAFILDGDNIRHGLNKNLGFSPADRTENIRRIGEVAKLFTESGMVALTAFISPYRADRDQVRAVMAPGDFVEVLVDCPIEVCEERDVKGLYKKARAGQIPEFTGVSAPYEPPLKPELTIRTHQQSVEQSARQILDHLERTGVVPRA